MIPAANWGEYSPESSAARWRAEQRLQQEANNKKPEETRGASLATTLIENNVSASQTNAKPEAKEAQCFGRIKSRSAEDKETKQSFWTSTKRKISGIFKS